MKKHPRYQDDPVTGEPNVCMHCGRRFSNGEVWTNKAPDGEYLCFCLDCHENYCKDCDAVHTEEEWQEKHYVAVRCPKCGWHGHLFQDAFECLECGADTYDEEEGEADE